MPRSSSIPCTQPSSPPRPCSATKTTSTGFSRTSSSSAGPSSLQTRRETRCPRLSSASATPSPVRRDTSRSALQPPINTPTRLLFMGVRSRDTSCLSDGSTSLRGSSIELREHGGDVVLATALVRQIDELLHRRLPPHSDDTRDVGVLQVPVEPIAAEEKAHPRREGYPLRVDLHVLPVAHRARDDVLVRRALRLLRRDETLFELPGDEGVVFRQLLDRRVVHEVDAAVAHLGGDRVVPEHEQRRDGGAHPAFFTVDLRDREHEVRCRLNGALHQPARRLRVFLGYRVDQLAELAEAPLDHSVERVDGLAAGHLACRVASHAVGDDVQPELVVHEESVLVGTPLAAQMRETVSRTTKRRLRHTIAASPPRRATRSANRRSVVVAGAHGERTYEYTLAGHRHDR